MRLQKLLAPGKIGSMKLKNRFVVPPMGTNLATYNGEVTEEMIAYYRRRAKGGFGLIIIEVTAIDRKGKAIMNEVGLWDDDQIPMFRKLMDAIHEEGGKVVVQLHHAGRQSVPPYIFNEIPEAPSRVACPVLNFVPEAMSNERVWEIIDEYGDAAVRAKIAGADGVEVHGAHGYLVAQFMSPHANKRTDEFGGDFFGRMKFPQEIFKNIRKKVGEDYPLLFRFGYDEKVNGGRTLEESVMVGRMAENCGVDALDVSIMTYASTPYMSAPPAMPHGFNQFPTKVIKEAVHIPVISVGRYEPAIAESALLNGCADFIAFGRESIADPDLPAKVAAEKYEEIFPCIGCTQSCLGYLNLGGHIRCLVNPLTGLEGKVSITKSENPKKVLVAGAGPGGLVASFLAARAGHEVILAEKSSEIGGSFRLAAIPPTKQDIATALRAYVNHCKKEGVDIRLNTPVTPELLSEINPDAVILATGGLPLRINLEGIDGENVIDAVDILDGTKTPGNRILMIGGGMTGVETADFLAEHNKAVTIIEMRPDIALDEASAPRFFLIPRLKEHGVEWIVNATVKKILPDGVIYEQNGSEYTCSGYDTIVLALGVKANNPLEEAARALGKQVFVIGDAAQPGPANKATEAALEAVLSL
ncbi:MAG: FAD-dependent oxidoreductase [Lachnospiraceae bacterium]|nr:FAD-dependent oxidoreductase [Lachnospiraceae bacterium]